MTVNPDAWLQLLIQVPLVGIFIWFALRQQELHAASSAKRDEEWRVFLREQREMNNGQVLAIINAQLERDKEWRQFLGEERKDCDDQLLNTIGQVTELAKKVEAITAIITLHDQRVEMSIPAMREAFEKFMDRVTKDHAQAFAKTSSSEKTRPRRKQINGEG